MKISKENTVKEIICRTVKYDGGVRPFHWHENIEICQVITNSGNFLVDGCMVEAKKGDIIVIGEQTVHQYLIPGNDTIIRIFQMSPKVLLDKDIGIKPLKTHISADEIAAVDHLEERLNILFDIVEKDGGSQRVGDIPYMKSVAASIYYLLMHHFPGNADTKSTKERQLFYKIADYVNENFARDITVQSIAEELYISRGKVGSVFTKYSGTGLNRYLNSVRIKNANMLMDLGCGISESALESGFQNLRTFNEAYKKLMNMTPSEYINNKKIKQET